MHIHFEDCDTLDECYQIQNNEIFISSQLKQLEMLGDSTDSQSFGRLMPSIEEEFTPSNRPNRVESLNIWKIHRSKTVEKFHLVICYASNEKGKSHSTKILIPSELKNKKTYEVQKLLARENDSEIVEGDDLSIVFRYHSVLYNPDKYKLNVRAPGPDNRCELDPTVINQEQFHHISVYDNDRTWNYTRLVELQFKNIIKDCSYNYSIELQVGSGEYFEGVTSSPVVSYNLSVLDAVKPYFIVAEAVMKSNKTVVQLASNNSTNSTDRYSMAYSGLFSIFLLLVC
jgi:hypothetical protein